MKIDRQIAKQNIQRIARELGFDDCQVSRAKEATHAEQYRRWIDDGCAGDMKWLEHNVDRRVDPAEVVEGAFSVVSLAMNYFPGKDDPDVDYRIARYAWNEDYHDIIEAKLKDLNLAMEELGGKQRFYTDTGPVLERDFASDAGLGWCRKQCSGTYNQEIKSCRHPSGLYSINDAPIRPAVLHALASVRKLSSRAHPMHRGEYSR